MVDLLEHLSDKEARLGRSLVRDLIKKIEPLMFHEDGAFFREAIEIMEPPEREMVYRRILRNQHRAQFSCLAWRMVTQRA